MHRRPERPASEDILNALMNVGRHHGRTWGYINAFGRFLGFLEVLFDARRGHGNGRAPISDGLMNVSG
jgi:hypothetical protein